MSASTKITWCHHTFSPWLCVHGTRRRTADSAWKQVERWNRKAAGAAERPRVFFSLGDPFEAWDGPIMDSHGTRMSRVSDGPESGWVCRIVAVTMDDVRRDFFALIDRCQNLDFILLTKRPENVRRMWPRVEPHAADAGIMNGFQLGYRTNVWLLFSASDQATLDSGLTHLLSCRDLVPVIGLSLEPLIDRVEIAACVQASWVLVGGESGPRARPCHVGWIKSVIHKCRYANMPCYVTQLGSNIRAVGRDLNCWPLCKDFRGTMDTTFRPHRIILADPRGGDPTEWPESLRVREFPCRS